MKNKSKYECRSKYGALFEIIRVEIMKRKRGKLFYILIIQKKKVGKRR